MHDAAKERVMRPEATLQFVQDRLRQRHSLLYRELHLRPPERVRRRHAFALERGAARQFACVDCGLQVHCAQGSVWITHDGDPRDVVLAAGERYEADREDPMHVFALQPSVVEIEFEDEVLEH
jgi:hypothetical protein